NGNDSTAGAAAPATVSAPTSQSASDELKVIGYAPERIKAGQAFNVQASGGSALWMKLDHSMTGSPAAIWWDDHRLDGPVNGDVISTMVPASLYATAGTHSLQVRLGKDGQGRKSNIVKVTVE
ncbi:MAG: hypothetical protein ABI351_09850, partial [Herbaspirillum sp.]